MLLIVGAGSRLRRCLQAGRAHGGARRKEYTRERLAGDDRRGLEGERKSATRGWPLLRSHYRTSDLAARRREGRAHYFRPGHAPSAAVIQLAQAARICQPALLELCMQHCALPPCKQSLCRRVLPKTIPCGQQSMVVESDDASPRILAAGCRTLHSDRHRRQFPSTTTPGWTLNSILHWHSGYHRVHS